jgi:prepilin-type N-terminal cleavage/methylation domain-containing protein
MNRRGFTFIEILLVTVIVGILANLAIPYYMAAKIKADAAVVIADFNAIKVAAFDGFAKNGTYPASTGWRVVPPALVASLPDGFEFTYRTASYRWRRWATAEGLPQGGVIRHSWRSKSAPTTAS